MTANIEIVHLSDLEPGDKLVCKDGEVMEFRRSLATVEGVSLVYLYRPDKVDRALMQAMPELRGCA